MPCECLIVNGTYLTSNSFVPGITNISVSPSNTRGFATGSISITAHAFNAATGPYLEKVTTNFCRYLKVSAEVSYLTKMMCSVDEFGSTFSIPGEDNAGSRTFFYPQVLSPVTIETGGEDPVDIGGGYTFELGDVLNEIGANSPAVSIDASGGPQTTYQRGFVTTYKYINFQGLHPLFTFNTLSGSIDQPSTMVLTLSNGETHTFTAYTQSFSLTVEPPRPATITFNFTYEDENAAIQEIDSCSES